MAVITLKSITQKCMQLFASISDIHHHSPDKHTSQLTSSKLVNEYDRFKVWGGNLGARQRGHASLDWRLRNAEVMTTSIRKLLEILHEQLKSSHEIISLERPPYEEQSFDFDCVSDDDQSDDSGEQLPELERRWQMIVATIKSLYKLSFSIRRPGARVAPEKAEVYRELIPGSELDFGDALYSLDRMHVVDLLNDLRRAVAHGSSEEAAGQQQAVPPDAAIEPLTDRLTSAVTRRRRKFRYCKRHRQKLSQVVEDENEEVIPGHNSQEPGAQAERSQASKKTRETSNTLPQSQEPRIETNATSYAPIPLDNEDLISVAQTASTARDLEGQEAVLARPPETHGGDWECQLCFVLCPAAEGTGRRWRKHLLEDLQPYLCTYLDCPLPGQLFGSRTAWLAHEDTFHRQVWRCRDHRDSVFATSPRFQAHLARDHPDLRHEHVQAVIDSSATVRVDSRAQCPICLVSVTRLRKGQNLLKHIANHLERIACFALPRSMYMEADDDDGNDDSLRMPSSRSDLSLELSTEDLSAASNAPKLNVIAPSPTGSEGSEVDSEEAAGDLVDDDFQDMLPDPTVMTKEISREGGDEEPRDNSSDSGRLPVQVDQQSVNIARVPLLNVIAPSPPESVTGTDEVVDLDGA